MLLPNRPDDLAPLPNKPDWLGCDELPNTGAAVETAWLPKTGAGVDVDCPPPNEFIDPELNNELPLLAAPNVGAEDTLTLLPNRPPAGAADPLPNWNVGVAVAAGAPKLKPAVAC